MEPIANAQPTEAQEAEKSAELEALRAIYMEELVTSEEDLASFSIDLLSTERKDPVRVIIAFKHPPCYPDQPLHVEAIRLEGLPPSARVKLTEKLQEKAAEMIGSASAFPIVELAKEWIERAAMEEEHAQDNSFFKELAQALKTEEEETADSRDYVAYSCWTEEDLLSRQNKKARRVADALSLSIPLATVLLRYFEWNVDKLYAQYLKQPEQVLQAAGVKVQPASAQVRSSNCLICDEPPSTVHVERFLSCGHTICTDCWVQYLTVKVQTGEVNSVRCPAFKCTALVPDDVVERLLPADLMSKYRRWVLRGFLSRSHSARWCPRRDCSNVVRASTDVATIVRCLCGHLFCFACGDEAHYPALCATAKAWRNHYSASEQEARAQEWLRANTKPCARCKAGIEKNGGCNHMTCRKCSYEFCWICGALWNSSHYTCNRVDPVVEKNKKAKEGLQRYTWYSDHFTAHDVSGRLEESVRAKVTQKAIQILESGNKSLWHQAAYVQQAAEVLLRCRLVLKWSFALGYEPPKGFNVPLFEFLQQDFEVGVDKLAYGLEHNSTEPKFLRSSMLRAEHQLFGFLQFCEQEQHTRFYLRALMTSSNFTLDFTAEKRDLRGSGNKNRLALSQSATPHHTSGKSGRASGILFEVPTGGEQDAIPRPLLGSASALRVSRVSTSEFHGFLVTEKGQVFAWGINQFGQLGFGDNQRRSEPEFLPFFEKEEGETPVEIIAVAYHSLALMPSGRVYGWGSNIYRQLGLGGGGYSVPLPSRISTRLDDHVIVQIASCATFTLFLTQEGIVYSCGTGIAAGSHANIEYPTRNVFFNPEREQMRRVGCTDQVSFAISTQGQFYVWGIVAYNDSTPAPQLMNPQRERGQIQSTPVKFREAIVGGRGIFLFTQSASPVTDFWFYAERGLYHGTFPEPMALRASTASGAFTYSTGRVLYQLDSAGHVNVASPQLSNLPILSLAAPAKQMLLIIPEDAQSTLSGSLRVALLEGLCADVVFVVQDLELPVNKALLLARCPAFAKEAFASATDKSRVRLSAKLDVATVRAFLEFLYSDHIRSIPEAATKNLLALGRQYNLPRLIAVVRGGHVPSTLGEDLWARRSETAEAVLETPDGEVKAHQIVVAARIPYFRALYRGDKVKRSTEAVSSILSAETLVAWSYEQPCSLEGATYEELTALMADADFLDAPSIQALAEQKLVGHSLMQTNPLLFAEFVPFAQNTLIRALRKLTASKRDQLLLEERYPKRLLELDAFIKNIAARNDLLIALQARFDEASSVS